MSSLVRPAGPARGRPRDPAADTAILRATFRRLVDDGYAGLSIEAVAADAGVAKTTVYRRWPTKRELVVAALQAATPIEPPPLGGDVRETLRTLLRQVTVVLFEAHAIRILGTLLAEEPRDPELIAIFRQRILEPRRAIAVAILEAAAARGELRDGVNVDVASEMLMGSVIAHFVRTGHPGDPPWIDELVEAIWRSIERPGAASPD